MPGSRAPVSMNINKSIPPQSRGRFIPPTADLSALRGWSDIRMIYKRDSRIDSTIINEISWHVKTKASSVATISSSWPYTEGLMMRDSSLLPQVAPQRLHDELYAILPGDGAAEEIWQSPLEQTKQMKQEIQTKQTPDEIPASALQNPQSLRPSV